MDCTPSMATAMMHAEPSPATWRRPVVGPAQAGLVLRPCQEEGFLISRVPVNRHHRSLRRTANLLHLGASASLPGVASPRQRGGISTPPHAPCRQKDGDLFTGASAAPGAAACG